MTAAIHYLPNVGQACDRMTARAKAENEAEERQASVERARRIIRKPKGYTDGQLRTACGFYMTHGDGGPDYLLADQHLFAINKRQQIARNRAKAAALFHEPADETSARIAKRFRPQMLAMGAGLTLAALVAVAFNMWVL